MEIKVMVFGQLTDITGSGQISVKARDTDSLLLALQEAYPGLRFQKFAIAVDKKMIRENTQLTGSDEVALMPPFSGG
jgi:molybdopterin converting factor small subunit